MTSQISSRVPQNPPKDPQGTPRDPPRLPRDPFYCEFTLNKALFHHMAVGHVIKFDHAIDHAIDRAVDHAVDDVVGVECVLESDKVRVGGIGR